MTVLVAVNTPDVIVIGSDSQGTITRRFIAPENLTDYFDHENGHRLKVDEEGQPLLDAWSKVTCRCVEVPYKSHTEVDKLFSLEPLRMGIMVTGIASIGDRTIKSLISEFRDTGPFIDLSLSNYTLGDTATALLGFLRERYLEKYPADDSGPELELMMCGYDRSRYTPGMVRIYVHQDRITEPDYEYCVFLGGTTREIQRIGFGIDCESKIRLIERSNSLLEKYHHLLTEQLAASGVDIGLKKPEDFGSELSLFNDWKLENLEMNCATFSERDAIDCVEFLVNVMIKSQKFSKQVPNTGGSVQIAVIDKQSGFRFVSPPGAFFRNKYPRRTRGSYSNLNPSRLS